MPGWLSYKNTPDVQPFAHTKSPLSQSISAAINSLFDALQTYDSQQNNNISSSSLCFFKVAMNILNSGRFGIGAGAGGGLRRLIGNIQSLATDCKIQIYIPCILYLVFQKLKRLISIIHRFIGLLLCLVISLLLITKCFCFRCCSRTCHIKKTV